MSRGQIFKSISGKKPRTNVFDLSHEKKLSGNPAELIPIFLEDTLPGSSYRVTTELLIRLAPLMAPLMHRVNAYVHYFHVPYRLLWDNWKDFITGGVQGTSAPTHPYIPISETVKGKLAVGSLADYLGIPPVDQSATITGVMNINSLPFRAYQLIYNEYYRDQTLTNEQFISKGDGAETDFSCMDIKKRMWEKDYFSSALTKSQRGDDVLIPMDVLYRDYANMYQQGPGETPIGDGAASFAGGALSSSGGGTAKIENIEGLSATINDLRTSVALQQWLEKNARAGARYVEQILAHFGRRVPDYRLQRPEYIGGGKQPIVISEVLSNFESTETPQGKMTGHGISAGSGAGFKYTCDEHGLIMGILSVMPRSCYYQGVPRMYFRNDKLDYAFPEFAHLGEQQIFSNELYIDYGDLDHIGPVFGYQSRYAEHKYVPDTVHGEMRTNLEFWHWGRKFSSPPVLNHSFVECNPDTRIFAVQDEASQKLWIQLYNNVRAIKPLPVYGTPIL